MQDFCQLNVILPSDLISLSTIIYIFRGFCLAEADCDAEQRDGGGPGCPDQEGSGRGGTQGGHSAGQAPAKVGGVVMMEICGTRPASWTSKLTQKSEEL